MSFSSHLIHCIENWMTPFFSATLLLSPVVVFLLIFSSHFLRNTIHTCYQAVKLLVELKRLSSVILKLLSRGNSSFWETWLGKKPKRDRRNIILPQSQIYNTGGGFLGFFWSVSPGQSDKTKSVIIYHHQYL